jgi:heterodisulfide reductase subunit A2
MDKENVLIIGSGVAGMEASIMLSKAGKKVYLVEKLLLIGGRTIKNEETFPNMACSTCLVAPIQQEILQDPNIEVLTLSEVRKVSGEQGNFKVSIKKTARYISMEACLGCEMCYPVCPVELSNEWEGNLGIKHAVYVSTSGSLPNVPRIDPEHCLKLNGKDESCNICVETCMFGAIDFSHKDEMLDIDVTGIIIATGYDTFDAAKLPNLGYGKYSGVYSSAEFERLNAKNGPTEGALTLRDTTKTPESIAIIHCVGREEVGYCSSVCCMSSLKHARFIKLKLPNAKVYNIYTDICLPDKSYQKFYDETKSKDSELLFQSEPEKMNITDKDGKLEVAYINGKGKRSVSADMVILANSFVPASDLGNLAKMLDIKTDNFGYIETEPFRLGSVETSKPGIFAAGCVEGPKDVQSSFIQSEAAVAGLLSMNKE